jgi:threonine synthase
VFTETAGGVTTAVLAKLAERGEISADERIVLYITGEGLKTLDATRELFEMHQIDPSLEDFEHVVERDRAAAASGTVT